MDDFFWFVVRGMFLMYAALILLYALLFCLAKIIEVLFPLVKKKKEQETEPHAYEYVDAADRYVRSLPIHEK